MDLTPYLQDVEARIDPMEEDALAAAWLEFCDLKCTKPYFYINRKPKPSALTWPRYTINDGFRHQDIMLYLQLKSVSDTLAGSGGAMLAVRANYGTGIIPSMFGTEIFALADHQNTLPGTVPLERGMEAVREIAAEGKIDYTKGLAPQVFSFGEKWLTLAAQYPKIAKYVHLYCPDLQGPYPLLDMLVGYDLFFSLYDEPDDVKAAMDFITEVYLDFTRKWFSLAPTYDDDHAVEWGLLHRGKIMLRNDAIMNLSGEMYDEFAKPWDARAFREFGGCMHYCGRGDHYIPSVCTMEGLDSINLSQPEMNDMDVICQATIEQGKTIVGLPGGEVKRMLDAGRDLMGRVHSWAKV